MVRIIERVAGRYDVREMVLGRVYRWFPERVVLECDCGERPVLTGSMTTCARGADYADAIQEGPDAERSEDEALRPWRYAGGGEDAGIPY